MTTQTESNRVWASGESFWDQGLLFYVNSTVLWPLGYALAITIDEGVVKDELRIIRLDPAETIFDHLPDEEDQPRHRAAAHIAARLAQMSDEERNLALMVLRDPLNVAAFLADVPGANSLDRLDLSGDGS